MAGGTWQSQNKIQPGVYINTKSAPNLTSATGDRGVVVIAKMLDWGADNTVMTINNGDDYTPFIGNVVTSQVALFLREIFKGSNNSSPPLTVLLYKLTGTGAVAAKATIGALTATAVYMGVRGNDISIIITADPDNDSPQMYVVQTIIDGTIQDSQSVSDISSLIANDWVIFSGTGTTFTTSAGTPLTGGVNGTLSTTAHADFLTAIEPYDFNVIIYDDTDATTQEAYISFVKRMRDNEGKKCQLVLSGYDTGANSEAVINVGNGVILSDGTILSAAQVTWWVGGAEAGASYNQSLTYAQYLGAKQASPILTSSQIDTAILAGDLVFADIAGSLSIVTDINTLTTYTVNKGKEYRKNRIIRTLDTICNDFLTQFSLYYIGKVNNNADGRDLFRGWIVGYLNNMQANNGIQNFLTDDVEVIPGGDVDSIIVNANIQPVDSIEKVYVTVTVNTTVPSAE